MRCISYYLVFYSVVNEPPFFTFTCPCSQHSLFYPSLDNNEGWRECLNYNSTAQRCICQQSQVERLLSVSLSQCLILTGSTCSSKEENNRDKINIGRWKSISDNECLKGFHSEKRRKQDKVEKGHSTHLWIKLLAGRMTAGWVMAVNPLLLSL